MTSSSKDDLYGSGLAYDDWYAMRDVVLATFHDSSEEYLVPDHLSEHAITKLIRSAQSGDKNALCDAARMLVPIDPDRAWLALEKS